MSDLTIERIGGFAGFGLPNSRLKSRGHVAFDDLAGSDKTAVEALFSRTSAVKPSLGADGFCYRITRKTTKGLETVEVPEALVPPAIVACVKDEIE